ncbi:hypothetical protein [Streptomyces scopuliridis]|uniref:Uncharacterized protein n=1 Tax=Streptomyces scopuliridis TaxID=452529 RepID=A0ACD4ZNQ1_9ACTN|nr:hypothetical protein [Streptomyces scopuliridis]WSC00113.1 hypothetical protein OG835_26015 [Streptomyces scopuliridis]
MSARDTLHAALLTTPAAQKLPHPEGWASTRIKRYRDEVRTETLAEVAEMLDRVGHPAAALVLRYADKTAGPEEKTTPNAGTAVTPQVDSGLTADELAQTPDGTHRCPCGHWDNIHGPFCFAAGCSCGNFTHASTATAQPEPELTVRQQRLLDAIRQDPTGLRSTKPVGRLYREWHIHTPDQEARRDLAALAEHGYLTAYGDDTGRRYRLTRKDGQR